MQQRQAPFSQMLVDPETPASILVVGLMDEFGTDFFNWEPDTLLLETQSVWKVQPPSINRDKIWALVTEITTNLFYQNLDAFNHVCNALSGSNADFQNWDPVNVRQMCWGIAEVSLADPPEKGDEFSEEIKIYMRERLEFEGFSKVPKLLKDFVKLPDRSQSINETLTSDAIGFKSYWDAQQRKLLEIDEWCQDRMNRIIVLLGTLPLQNADQKALAGFRERAATALAAQSRTTTRELESVPLQQRS